MDVYVMTLEDGKDYYIIDTIIINTNKYLIFAKDNNEYTVRKVVIDNGKEAITKLDNKSEYDEVMIAFTAKHKGELDEK